MLCAMDIAPNFSPGINPRTEIAPPPAHYCWYKMGLTLPMCHMLRAYVEGVA